MKKLYRHKPVGNFESSKKGKAFTLIELLVVIAIIALLLSVIMPSLNKAKQIAAAAVCMSNNGQMSVAYYMYADENSNRLVDGSPAPADSDGFMSFDVNGNGSADYPKQRGFVANPSDKSGYTSNTSLDDKIRGFMKGGLWSYLEAHKVYNCPVDRRWNKPPDPGSVSVTNTIGGYRSYSIGSVLSAGGFGQTNTGEDRATIVKYSGFSNPSSKIVFLEEADGSGLNDNYWNMFLNQEQWWDPFAIWHNGSSTFGYADGHADRHKWTDENLIKMANGDLEKVQPIDPSSDDYQWFKRAYAPKPLRR